MMSSSQISRLSSKCDFCSYTGHEKHECKVNPDGKPSYNLINRLLKISRKRNLSEDKIRRLKKWRDNYIKNIEKKRKRDATASDAGREEEQEEPPKKKAFLSLKKWLISNKRAFQPCRSLLMVLCPHNFPGTILWNNTFLVHGTAVYSNKHGYTL
jgi:hypothetical protein